MAAQPVADSAAREAVRLAGEAIRRAEAALHIAQGGTANAPAGGCGCEACALAMGGTPAQGGGQNGGTPAPATPSSAAGDATAGELFAPLYQAVVRGLSKAAQDAANAAMDAGAPPLSVVEHGVIPALTEVGARYERGAYFLPQLMQSATAAKLAIDTATARMPDSKPAASRTVLLATVHGDVHDIGKNIVATLLGSYGFGVIDLGRNVPPEAVVAAAREAGVTLVGLSALMTTTVPAMRETIVQLRRELPQVRIMVGGAVLTPELAQELGADAYAADAMGSVRIAGELLGDK
jgi:5-methyltetrahydrofolate--homocysteine methyltransferase